MCARNITLEWVNKAEEDAAVAERESRVRKRPSPGAVCYHGFSGTGNLCLNYCSASPLSPSIATVGQHQRPRSDSRQQMSGSRSAILHARPSFSRFVSPELH